MFSQLLLLDPEQLLKLISIENIADTGRRTEERERPGRAAGLSGTGLALRPGARAAPSLAAWQREPGVMLTRQSCCPWFGEAAEFVCSSVCFLGLGETKMVPVWSGNYDSIWPAREGYDAAYSQSYGNRLAAGKSHGKVC